MSEVEICSYIPRRDSSEDIFQVDITRSELSYYICQNQECEAAKKFGDAGIGPLRKWPKGLYLTDPPVRKIKVDAEVQSPKKMPCGDPKCRYLNIHKDGTPKGCGKKSCKYAKKICDDPCCALVPQTGPIYCDVCGGFSLSGKTCKDISSHPALSRPAIESTPIEDIYVSPEIKKKCGETCTLPPRPKTPPPPLPLPVSDAPFDQLLGAANLETLRSIPQTFIEVLLSLNEYVMNLFEKYFDRFNPHIRAKSQNRGEVFANNNFYNFYFETVRLILQKIKTFLVKIWNIIIEFKKLDLPPVTRQPISPDEFLEPVDGVAHEIVMFVNRKLGLKAREQELFDNVQSIIAKCVTTYKGYLPSSTYPSPRSSQELVAVEIKQQKENREAAPSIPLHLFYLGIKLGHKCCIPAVTNAPMVPKNMGWLWTARPNLGRLKPVRFYQPGAVPRSIARKIREYYALLGKAPTVVKKVRPKQEDDEEVIPMLEVRKKDGCYLITFNPIKNPYWTPEENEECSPLSFLVTKNRDKIMKVNPDGSCECVCECDKKSVSTESVTTSEDEIEILYTPPICFTDPSMVKPKKRMNEEFCQYDPNDCPGTAEKGKGKKGKK